MANKGQYKTVPDDLPQALVNNIELWRQHLPEPRVPTIMVCGTAGRGKTTTINTLFGEEVGRVGHFARGTEKDEVYEWESNGTNINIIDLPGLGDAPKNDRIFSRIYRERVRNTDAFLVVTVPPRPIDHGTLKTINLLRHCGVPSTKIVIGINRLDFINVPDHRVVLNGIAGPATDRDTELIELQRKGALQSLMDDGGHRFSDEQVLPYDALSGWNIYNVLGSMLEKLPIETLPAWQRVVENTTKELTLNQGRKLRKETERLARERAELESELSRLRDEQVAIKKRKRNARKRANRERKRRELKERIRLEELEAIGRVDRASREEAQRSYESERFRLEAARQDELSRQRSELNSELASAIRDFRYAIDTFSEVPSADRTSQLDGKLDSIELRAVQSELLADVQELKAEYVQAQLKWKLEEVAQREVIAAKQESQLRELAQKQSEHDEKVAGRMGKLLLTLVGHAHAAAIMTAVQSGSRFVKRLFRRK